MGSFDSAQADLGGEQMGEIEQAKLWVVKKSHSRVKHRRHAERSRSTYRQPTGLKAITDL